MSTSLAAEYPSLSAQPDVMADQTDPFLSASTSSNHHRFSHFDNQLFALGPTTSPDQAKRALEAHLAETERRIQEASKLGTTLVQQRKDLAERLKDVEKQQNEGDITPELRQKLVEIEREYNEVGRETARAFLPKSRVSSSEMGGSPFTGDAKRSVSPSKFESQATNSPSKLSVPNRKQRNQPANRVHDIEFATEISTSLLSQVRNLQALLAEKEEALKAVSLEKSRLEVEAEGFSQRLRSLDESEHRYKDENWNLETQIHEFLAAAKEAADREKKLVQTLSISQAEKTSAQKELDEIKLSHAKLADDHAAALKHHDVELGSVKRNMSMAENERGALQRKIEDLTGQNQELAKAVAHQRGRLEDREQARGLSDEDFETAPDNVTPEHSPPPSPVKGTPRHSMLESETLKSSLHHAHRMIQNLKGNIHREKTEKLELKRMLQDARDELESRRSEGGMGSANGKRSRKVDSREFKKPLKPGQLGGLRSSRSEIFIDDTNWEEDNGQRSPSYSAAVDVVSAAGGVAGAAVTDSSDHFETANEQETDAFETANERGTETEDFQTGVEDMSGSDELTETEGGPIGTIRNKPTPALSKPGNRDSFQSTASTSGDEYSYEELKTPTSLAQPQRLRLRVSRGGNRRSRITSEEPQLQSSPASFANSSRNGTPQAAGQSLFAELGDLGGSDDEDSIQGTPSRSSFLSQTATPSPRPSMTKGMIAPILLPPPEPRLSMVDSGMMTEPWEAKLTPPESTFPHLAGAGLTGPAFEETAHLINDKHASTSSQVSTGSQIRVPMSDASSQWQNEQFNNLRVDMSASRPISTSTYSDRSSQYDPIVMEEKLAEFPSPPRSRPHTPMASLAGLEALAAPLSMSAIVSEHVEPIEPKELSLLPKTPERVAPSTPKPAPAPAPSPMAFSSIQSVDTEPITAKLAPVPAPVPAPMALSSIQSVDTEPITAKLAPVPAPVPAPMAFSSIQSVDTEPLAAKLAPVPAPIAFSSIQSVDTEPITAKLEPAPVPMAFSSIQSVDTEPITAKLAPAPVPMVFSSIQSIDTEPSTPKPEPVPAPMAFSSIKSVDTEPIEPLSPRSLRRGGVMIPRDEEEGEMNGEERPQTPKSNFVGSTFGWNKNKAPETPIIAEDDTRQSPSDSPMDRTPESQRPFKELSHNTNERAAKKSRVETSDESVQTSLTSEQIDAMIKIKRQDAIIAEDSQKPVVSSPPRSGAIPSALRVRKSQESIASVGRARSKMADPDFIHDTVPLKRPTSAGSQRRTSISSIHPPLPTDHKQVIAAAAQRTGSSSGGPGSMGPPSLPATTQRAGSSSGPGSMGPPLVPASAYRSNPSFRPRTPSSQPMSPGSVKGGTTPRAGRAEVQSPTGTGRSRRSSVSSFASELDNRFNIRAGMLPQGVEAGTDPRMINAITQTMIGEYLWKYTRKAGRGAMSENRHRRYFWVHPYTRTLYWSDRDPSQAGRAELKAKSVPIEAVRVVTDDNPMPPGLHRKSLVIMTPGRAVKFTATTGQRHETWFNALSYLLLRTGEEKVGDSSEVANGALTREDVNEFNPGFGTNSQRGPASLSSYNSRTTRNDSPARNTSRMSVQPQLVPSASSRPTGGTLSRLTNYWKPGGDGRMSSLSSRRSRHSVSGATSIYEASEVHDSAEDLREMIEKQDRESDRLENVRACCDGKHDVGHLHTGSHKGRHSHNIPAGTAVASGSGSQSQRQTNQRQSRNSVMRRTD